MKRVSSLYTSTKAKLHCVTAEEIIFTLRRKRGMMVPQKYFYERTITNYMEAS